MNDIRRNSVYLSDKTVFYAQILSKAKCIGTQAKMTHDQICDCELTDKWEHEFPQLVEAYETNCELKQRNKKDYAQAEAEIISSLLKQ